jgi:hypothetical protein
MRYSLSRCHNTPIVNTAVAASAISTFTKLLFLMFIAACLTCGQPCGAVSVYNSRHVHSVSQQVTTMHKCIEKDVKRRWRIAPGILSL